MIVRRALLLLVPFVSLVDLAGADDSLAYVRMEVTKDGSQALQTAWRLMQPPKDSGKPVVWLIGVSHLGEKSYYEKTQAKLDAVDLVLFEGIGFDANATARAKEKSSSVSALQTTLADSLGLVFQLDAISYDRLHFRNSDLGVVELQAKLGGSGSKPKSGKKRGGDPEVRAFVKMLEGDSFALSLVQGILKLFQGNPQFQAMARLVIIETIAASEGDVSKLVGATSPSMRRLFKTLIDDRNAVVLRDLREAIRAKEPPASVAVFYGAGHMIDMETRLREKLGYRPAGETWVTAFAVNPGKAGLSVFETSLVRRLVRAQIAKLRKPAQPGEPRDR